MEAGDGDNGVRERDGEGEGEGEGEQGNKKKPSSPLHRNIIKYFSRINTFSSKIRQY